MCSPWVFLDLETTGLDERVDQIIEVATITVGPGEKEIVWATLVNPGVPIPSYISSLTGIDEKILAEAPLAREIKLPLQKVLEGRVIVAHNALFDFKFLEAFLGPLSNLWLDTLQLTKIIFPHLPSYSLRYLIKKFALPGSPDHRAYTDARAVRELFIYLQKEINKLSLAETENIHHFLADETQGLSHFWADILREKVRNFDFQEPLLLVPASPEKKEKADDQPHFWEWDEEKLVQMFAVDGDIAQGFHVYEERTPQIKMMQAIARAFQEKRFLLVEAGTGVGKSLAYLVPALAWAVSQKEKVVVATHTIALQEQLWCSDIQYLKDNLPFGFNAAILKGRGNYFCLREWQEIQKRKDTFSWSERVFGAQLAHWLVREKTGDKDTIALRGREAEMFAELSSTKENCWGNECPFYRECFYQKARKRAQSADLLIVNHSLLLADLKIGDALLPEYYCLIIDEAHHLEEEGTKQFTETFSLRAVQKKINLFRRKNLFSPLKEISPKINGLVEDLRGCSQDLNQKTEVIFQKSTVIPQSTMRIKAGVYEQEWWRDLEELFTPFWTSLREFTSLLKQLVHVCQEEGEENSGKTIGPYLQVCLAEIEQARELGIKFFHTLEEGAVYWLETKNKFRDLLLQITPLQIAGLYQELLFAKLTTMVLTSATLSVADNFDFLKQRLGLPEDLVDTLQIPSPFHYETQSLLLINDVLPEPTFTGGEEYERALQETLCNILGVTGGKTLVLFTSHQQLQKMYYSLKSPLREKGLEIFADKIDGRRHVLLDELKNNPAAIVFGANTFWEGIDLPGPSLTAIIMVRLPFWPPGHPLVEARMEAVEQEGKNSFFHYSLPQAVLRFRQGYGRLIRTINDWGVVIILDNRLLKRRYGSIFLRSLPQGEYFTGNTQEMMTRVENWFKKWRKDHKSRGDKGEKR